MVTLDKNAFLNTAHFSVLMARNEMLKVLSYFEQGYIFSILVWRGGGGGIMYMYLIKEYKKIYIFIFVGKEGLSTLETFFNSLYLFTIGCRPFSRGSPPDY